MRTLAAAFCLATAAVAGLAPAVFAQSSIVVVGDPRGDTLRRLNKPVSVDLKETRLQDALMFVEQVGDLTLEPMWTDDAGATAGLEKDKPITLSVKNMELLSLLERILEKAQGNYGENTWQLTPSGMVEVGPKERLNRHATVKIYDIHDITFVVPDFPDVPQLDLDTVLQQTSQRGGGGSSGGGIFNQTDTQNHENDEAQKTEDIVKLIQATIEPEQWQENGGDGASIRILNGNLFIKAPDYIHRQIGGYPFAPPVAHAGPHAAANAAAQRRYVTLGVSVQSATPLGDDTQQVTGATSNP